MEQDNILYAKLRAEIDTRMPLGLPQTQSGEEIKLLKYLFTPEEAKIAILLSALPESINKIYRRVQKAGITISFDDLGKMLDNLVVKGAIMGGKIFPKPKHYSLAQLVVGMYEFQVDRMTREYATDAEKYMRSAFLKEFCRTDRPRQLRTIPIGQSLSLEHHVSTYDDVRAIVQRTQEPIVLTNCVCKQTQDLFEHRCKLSDIRHNCISFGNMAEWMLEKGVASAKIISKSELLNLLDQYQKVGFILQPENAQDPKYLCVCCGCCCGVLNGYKLFPRPADFFTSNFYAQVNANSCKGCGTCVKRCQMEAITNVNKKAVVNLDRCIGCGNCLVTCPSKAVSLVKKTQELVPPKTHDALYVKIIMKKKGFLGTLKLLGKILLGRKI